MAEAGFRVREAVGLGLSLVSRLHDVWAAGTGQSPHGRSLVACRHMLIGHAMIHDLPTP